MFLKEIGEFLPMIQRDGIEQAAPHILMKMINLTHSVDAKTRNKNVKEALKQFPQTKQMLKEMRKNIDEVL